jgi:uncharacterized SAM-dependent methyltransferase
MEKWEYWPADFPNDPAGGAAFWENLTRKPGKYYVHSADMSSIENALSQPLFQELFQDFDTVVELGAGSIKSIQEKTMPLLKNIKRYIVVDLCKEQGIAAAQFVKQKTGIDSHFIQIDYNSTFVKNLARGRTAFVMWGCAIGNIEGHKNESADNKLLEIYRVFLANCNEGDAYIVPFDTEQDESKVLAAYHEPLLSKKFLSILFAAKKFGLITGQFDPEVWRHKSEFYQEVGQCAHILYPTKDQNFSIRGQNIHIKAFEPRIENNSYKFKEDAIRNILKQAGFSKTHIFSERPMALTMAIK